MKNRTIMFFALLEDMQSVVEEIEASVDIKYYKMGLLDRRNVPAYNSLIDTPDVGLTHSGDWNRIDSYLVLKKQTQLNIRDVPQRNGTLKFAVDQLINPNSIEIKPGGICMVKENVLVAGRIATVSAENESLELYKLFSKPIRKVFRKIGSFYVGRKAEEKLKAGWRLVTNEKSPKDYDLMYSYSVK